MKKIILAMPVHFILRSQDNLSIKACNRYSEVPLYGVGPSPDCGRFDAISLADEIVCMPHVLRFFRYKYYLTVERHTR